MHIGRPTVFWVSVCVVSLVTLALLRPILFPFAAGLALAYLLAPTVRRLEHIGINRSLAALMLVLLLLVVLGSVLVVLLPAIIEEVKFFIADFPRTLARVQSIFIESSGPWLRKVAGAELRIEDTTAKEITAMGGVWVEDALRSAWSGGEALFSLLSLLVVLPIVTIYLLVDWDRMVETVDGWLPPGKRDDAQGLAREIRDSVAGFIRGQIVICLILAGYYAIALKLTGLDHAVLIGITAGLISFVPYLGAAAGLVIALCVGVAQFWPNWPLLATIVGIFLVGENVADYILSPRIIGSRVQLNPVWLMFALFAFAYLFGFIGLLVAIPLASALGVVVRFAMRRTIAP